MADELRQESQDPDVDNIFNSSIGDDWGEAFEAEDFMASPNEEASSEFFLPEEPTTGQPTTGLKPHEKDASPALSPTPGGVSTFSRTLTTRFFALPLPARISSVAIPILLGLALTIFLPKSHETPPAKTAATSPPTTTIPQSEIPTSQTTMEATGHQTEEAPLQPQKAPAVAAKQEIQEIRKKWRFPAILVQAKTNKDQNITMLSTDLTLVLKVHPEIMLPFTKDAFVREMIYQFYANQPADDLRRYDLERGVMAQKLQSWITKQWPGLPLDSINVDRYQLL